MWFWLFFSVSQWSWSSIWTIMWTSDTRAWWRSWGTVSERVSYGRGFTAGTPPPLLSWASLMPTWSSTQAGEWDSVFSQNLSTKIYIQMYHLKHNIFLLLLLLVSVCNKNALFAASKTTKQLWCAELGRFSLHWQKRTKASFSCHLL